MNREVQFRLRLYKGETVAIGPGKVALLVAIGEAGSISAAARCLGMSYRRAWLLVEELNGALAEPAVVKATGGLQGGGATLTPVGERIVALYKAVESKALLAARDELEALRALMSA